MHGAALGRGLLAVRRVCDAGERPAVRFETGGRHPFGNHRSLSSTRVIVTGVVVTGVVVADRDEFIGAAVARPIVPQHAPLAARLDMLADDLRLRLAGGLPAVFATVDDGIEADGHVKFLRARGHGAVTCNADTVRAPKISSCPSSSS